MQEKITTLNDVKYLHNSTTYTISNIKPKFFYNDSKQTAFISGQYLVIEGGRLQVAMTFDWDKSGSNGKGDGNGYTIIESKDYSFAEFYKV